MTPSNKASDSRTYYLFARWATGCYSHARWVLILTLMLAAACGIYIWRDLGMNTDTTDMLSKDLPFRVNLKHYNETFPQDMDTMLVVLEAPTPEQAQVSTKRLTALLKRDAFNFFDVYSSDVDDFFSRNALLYESVPELARITDRLAAAQPLIAHIARNPSLRAFADVISGAVNELRTGRDMELRSVLGGVSATLDARLSGSPRELSWQSLFQGEPQKQKYRDFIVVKPRLDYSQMFPAEQSISALRAAAKDIGITENSPVQLRITGEVALADDELNASLRGMEAAGVITFVLVGIVLYFAMRAGGLILNVLVCLTLGLILTAAFATAAVGHLNLISIAFAVLYIGLGADFAIHFLLRYRETLENGAGPQAAVHISGGEAGAALTACTITNAIGFYAFMPTDYRGVAELGIISGTGMIISLLVTLTVGPALLRYLPGRLPAKSAKKKSPIGRVLELSLKWHKATYAVTLAAAVGAVALLPQVRFDYNLLNLQDQKGEAIRTFRELLAETDQSPWHAVALASSRSEADILAQRLAQLPEVSKVVNLTDFVPREQAEKLPLIEEMALTMGPITISSGKRAADDAPADQLKSLEKLASTLDRFIADRPDHPAAQPARRLRSSLDKLLAQLNSSSADEKQNLLSAVEDDLLAALPIALRNLQTATEAAPFNEQTLPESLRQRWRSQAGEYRLAIYPAEDLNDNDALRRYVRAVQGVAPDATGAPMVSLEAGEAVVRAFAQAFMLALAGIVVALMIVLRSIKYTVLVLIPLLLSSLFTAAFTVLLNVPFNFANIIALPLLLGLGIDSSLHMVHRSLNHELVSEVLIHTSTARAIFYSALTALVDFASLMLSSHRGTASMGILLTVGLAFTLICTLVILPVLLNAPTRTPIGVPRTAGRKDAG
ncbi:MAG TPA: MMPL family transporter [Nitrosospira sp.]|nr:MMPL family transporter [Nitrosospira sp.]